MSERNVTVIQNGFSGQPTQEHLDRQERKKRMQERISNPKANPTNKDIQEQLNDLTAELLEQEKAK
jgi:hypothetical protein